jgi:hypothetical protein
MQKESFLEPQVNPDMAPEELPGKGAGQILNLGLAQAELPGPGTPGGTPTGVLSPVRLVQ